MGEVWRGYQYPSLVVGFMEKEGNGGGEEIVGLRSSSQARSGERFGIVRKALNLGE